jgi:hypothetical protein
MSSGSCTQVQSISGYMPENACHMLVIHEHMTVIYHAIPSIIKYITVYELCMGWYVTFRIPRTNLWVVRMKAPLRHIKGIASG